MTESKIQIAERFSEQVDRLMAGEIAPDQDPLLSIAAELAAAPVLDPSPAFTRRLRARLLSSAQTSQPRRWTGVRAALFRRRWSFVGVVTTLLLALTLALIWSPGAPSAAEVLARAADTVAAAPGQVTYVVSKLEVEEIDPGAGDIAKMVYSGIIEYWSRAGTVPDGRLTSVEIAGSIYAPGDAALSQPRIQHYSTLSRLCARSLDPSVPPPLDLNDGDCIILSAPAGRDPDPMAIYAGERFQHWIARMRANVEAIEFRDGRFNEHPVYSLTYREAGHATQSPITVNNTTTGTLVFWGGRSVPNTVISYTVTLYIDRETYLPVGVISRSSDPDLLFTQTILEYQVLDRKDLDFDPFVWPPEW
jgi:hypothetical protein